MRPGRWSIGRSGRSLTLRPPRRPPGLHRGDPARRTGSTEITGEFAVCPLCATLPRARVLSSAVRGVATLHDEDVGTMPIPGGEMALPRRFGMPPHREVRGQIDAMALYAGQSVGAVTDVKPAAAIIDELVQGAEDLLRVW